MATKRARGLDDDNKVRCKKCGFICDLERDKQGDGSGVTFTSVTDSASDNPVAVSGCPFCGTRNYTGWQR